MVHHLRVPIDGSRLSKRAASAYDCDTIVMFTHGRGEFGELH